MKKVNRILYSVVSIALVLSLLFGAQVQALGENASIELTPYWNEGESIMGISGKDISSMNLKDKLEILKTLTFDNTTKWPSKDKMPEGFDPVKVLEWGKDPGLGIRKLHGMGYTGKGVNIAYVDQPILVGHNEYKDRSVVYTKIRPDSPYMDSSMHGPAVLSLLSGKDSGVAPDSTVYFFGHPAWLADQRTHAEALEKLMEINKTLPADKRIRIVGFSDGPDPREENIDAYREAIKKAETSDIMVIDVNCGLDINPLSIQYPYDKSDAKCYEPAHWYTNSGYIGNALFVPTSGRTTACGSYPDQYVFWTNGGLSWAVPYVTGVIALGLQIDPQLTKEKAFAYLLQSGTTFENGRIINPEGFLALVTQNCPNPRDVSKDKDFRYFVYNALKVSDADLQTIKSYMSKFPVSEEAVLIDVSGCKTATDVYNMLKTEKGSRRGTLKGIQIFGTSGDVPAFDIRYKIQTVNGIDEGGTFKSDHFYSNFNSSVQLDGISIYDAFKDNLQVDFVPEWPVSRLPLTRDEYPAYIQKYDAYTEAVKGVAIPIVNFSSPIFAQKVHFDDTGVLLKRMSDSFKLINSGSYRLYGNLQGLFPVGMTVCGDFSKESLMKENASGICFFMINSHGQSDNIDQYIVDKDSNLENYAGKTRVTSLGNSTSEFRQSLVNTGDINTVLSKNYYNIFSRSCNNAYNLDENNIVHEAMAKGMLVIAITNSQVNSNNGVDVTADLDGLKKNNPAYNFMVFTYSLLSGNSASRSFCIAKSAYVQESLKNKTIAIDSGNYQYQLHNALVQSFLGLLEYTSDKNMPADDVTSVFAGRNLVAGQNAPGNIVYNGQNYDIPFIKSSQKSTLAFTDDGFAYCPVPSNCFFSQPGYKLTEFSAAVDADNVYIKVRLVSPISSFMSVHLAGDAPGLFEVYRNKIVKGNNVIIVKLSKQKLKQYTANAGLQMVNFQWVEIDKQLTDLLAGIKTETKFFAAPGIKLNGRLILFDQTTGYPYMDKSGNLLAPINALKAMGASVLVTGEKGTLTASKKGITVEFQPGSNEIYLNGKKVKLNVSTAVAGGIVYIPLKTFVESFGDKLSYNKALGVYDIILANK